MKKFDKKRKALALFSGGLDSMIAIKLLTLQNIEVIALYMDIGFGSKSDISETLKNRAQIVGATLEIVDVRQEYIDEILFAPKYGYGKHFNPCIDCHGYMFKIALSLLEKFDADFVISGEVVGQRPMSQRLDAMRSVKKLSGDSENLILRPLSAKNMPDTKAEIEGWVDKSKLLGISGRGRDTQLQMAKDFGWEDFQSPGGGCLLTDPRFATKMREFLKHESLHVKDIDILKTGRHLRLPDGAKLVVGRDEKENNILEKAKHSKFLHVKADEIPGPFSLLSKDASKEDKELCAKIVLTFAKTSKEQTYDVQIGDESIKATPLERREEAHKYFVIS
jgi:tRNA-specific 2-thiouridylase